MAAGVVGLDVLGEEVLGGLNALGERMKGLVEGVLRKHGVTAAEEEASKPAVNGHRNGPPPQTPKMYITGLSSLLHIHFSGPDQELLQALFFHHMLEENIYIAARGFIALSIEIRLRHVEHFVAALDG
ncbi:MAG: hypothetical protein M1830_006427, partial [Pleopsidium flavum]